MWAIDSQVDVTADGRQIRFANIIDEFTREALTTTAARSFTADDTTILLDKIIFQAGRRPANLRMDNGPELTANAMRDRCRFGGTDTAFIEPGSPWQNGWCESFNGRFRDELLTTEQFDTLPEAQDWHRTGGSNTTPTTPRITLRANPHDPFVGAFDTGDILRELSRASPSGTATMRLFQPELRARLPELASGATALAMTSAVRSAGRKCRPSRWYRRVRGSSPRSGRRRAGHPS